MKFRTMLVYAIILVTWTGNALCQQRPGGNGPLPGDPSYGGVASQELPPPPPQPTGEWIKTWGAIAGGANGEGGVSVGKLSKHDAETEAVFQCQKGGGVNCRPTMAYQNQCIAVTDNAGQTAGSIERAQELVVNYCRKKGGSECEILYSACSDPIFKRY